MNLRERNNVQIEGSGDVTLILSHGFGCDQSMWRLLLPHFSRRYRVVTYDLVGAGGSDLGAYDYEKYASLWGYAADLNEIIEEYRAGPVIVVGHSVSAMIAVLAEVRSPGSLAGLIILAARPVTPIRAPIPEAFQGMNSTSCSPPSTTIFSAGPAPWRPC